MSNFIDDINKYDVRVYPPKIELSAADIAPALADVIEGGTQQQVAVAMALVKPLNELLAPRAKKLGFMFKDPETGLLTYLNRRAEASKDGSQVWGWAKGRTLEPRA